MNDRRILLTKDEVRLLGTELTAETTDVIEYLYIPLDPNISYTVDFKYCTSSGGTFASGAYTYSNKTYRIHTQVYNDAGVRITPNTITCNLWNTTDSKLATGITVYVYGCYMSGMGSINMYDDLDLIDVKDENLSSYYIRINVNNIYAIGGSSTFKGWYLKIKSATNLPADTIFYEPYK